MRIPFETRKKRSELSLEDMRVFCRYVAVLGGRTITWGPRPEPVVKQAIKKQPPSTSAKPIRKRIDVWV